MGSAFFTLNQLSLKYKIRLKIKTRNIKKHICLLKYFCVSKNARQKTLRLQLPNDISIQNQFWQKLAFIRISCPAPTLPSPQATTRERDEGKKGNKRSTYRSTKCRKQNEKQEMSLMSLNLETVNSICRFVLKAFFSSLARLTSQGSNFYDWVIFPPT